MQEKIIILDFGSQTTQLIGRRIRELDTFCEILPYNKFPKDDPSVIGVILSGSPLSVYDKEAFRIDLNDIRGKYPILGICYGAQLISYSLGGRVEPAGSREYGRANLQYVDTAMVGHLGEAATAAVSTSTTPNWLIHSLPYGFTIGLLSLTSRAYGRGDREEMKKLAEGLKEKWRQ